MNRIRILLADDHAVVRQGFRAILAQQPDMVIVGEAGNGREVMALAQETAPDVIVMDVAMPELNGMEATRRLSASLPKARILALSMHKDAIYVREMLKAGARGYLLKDSGNSICWKRSGRFPAAASTSAPPCSRRSVAGKTGRSTPDAPRSAYQPRTRGAAADCRGQDE